MFRNAIRAGRLNVRYSVWDFMEADDITRALIRGADTGRPIVHQWDHGFTFVG